MLFYAGIPMDLQFDYRYVARTGLGVGLVFDSAHKVFAESSYSAKEV